MDNPYLVAAGLPPRNGGWQEPFPKSYTLLS